MNDYLDIYKKFEDVKDIRDYIEEVKKLRDYFSSKQYEKMYEHICGLTKKYALEAIVWNIINPYMPTTYEQAYHNAENFMCVKGAELITIKVMDYASRLSNEEQTFVESLTKPME